MKQYLALAVIVLSLLAMPQAATKKPMIATTTAHSVTLTWTASTSTGITGYNVYRNTTTTNSCSLTEAFLVGVGNVLTYTDTAVTNGASYCYYVTALSSGGESAPSNEALAQIPTPPAPPTAVTAKVN